MIIALLATQEKGRLELDARCLCTILGPPSDDSRGSPLWKKKFPRRAVSAKCLVRNNKLVAAR